MNRAKRHSCSVALGTTVTGILTLAAVPHVQASESAEEQNAATAGTAEPIGGLQEIVVTAQRREESLQHAAIAVSAVTADDLRNAGVTRPTELTSLVPALQVGTAAGPYNIFYLRGVGNFNGQALSDPAVAFNFNGVYIARTSGTTGFFYDLERVEVVKGPQGTLYGRNATGGAINVIPQGAKLHDTEGNVTVQYGNHDAIQTDAAVNMPIGDNAAVRAAGIFVKHDGYLNDGSDDQNDLSGRLSARVDPTSDLTISLTGDVFRQRGIGPGATPLSLGPDNRIGFNSAQGRAYYASQPDTLLGRTFAPVVNDPFMSNSQWGVSSTTQWKSGFGTLTFIPAYRKTNLDFVSIDPGFQIRQQEADTQTSVELRYSTDDSKPIRALLGGYYIDELNKIPLAQYNSQAQLSNQRYTLGTDSLAGFGRLTYAPMTQLRFTVGARYTSEDKRFSGINQSVLKICVRPTQYFPAYVPGCPAAQVIPYTALSLPPPNFNPTIDGTITVPSVIDDTGPNSKQQSFNKVTYRGGVDWDVTDSSLLYASYETGFKSGGFFFSGDTGTYKPETIDAWTVGSKNRFLDNRLQLNLEAFYWTYKDQQLSHLGFDSHGTVIFPTENVGRATFKGVEMEGQFLPLPNTLLSTDVQYLSARYDSFNYTTPNSNGGINNGTGCPSSGVTATSYLVNCSGFGPPNAPLWTLTLGAQQTFELPGGSKLVAEVHSHFQTRTLTGREFTPIEYQDAYWLLDTSVSYRPTTDKYFVTAFVNNALDRTVIQSSFPTTFSFFTVGAPRPPRTFGLRTGLRF